MLTADERNALIQNQIIERAVTLYLNLDEAKSQKDIADELDLTVRQLKYLTQSDEFKRIYDEYFSELGHDPRLKATRAGVVDLLPLAYNNLRSLLASPNTPATVMMKAIDKVFELNGVKPQSGKISDRKELAEFLKNNSINLTQINLSTEPQNEEALTHIIEGEMYAVEG